MKSDFPHKSKYLEAVTDFVIGGRRLLLYFDVRQKEWDTSRDFPYTLYWADEVEPVGRDMGPREVFLLVSRR